MAFTDWEKRQAWYKAQKVNGYDEDRFRKDACGAWIAWDKYGQRDNDFGWEIDHIYPEERGGDNNPANLRALHYKNNISKADDYPSYVATVCAEGNTNILVERQMSINKGKQEELARIYQID